MFNIFKKPAVLHCYTHRADVFNYAPVNSASKFLPDWWRVLPKRPRFDNTPKTQLDDSLSTNMKGCVGFTDLYKKGFIVPMWCDFAVEVGKTNSNHFKYYFSDCVSEATPHPQVQRGEVYPEAAYQHLKLVSPWRFVCEEDIDFLLLEPTWNFNAPEHLKILPGILNFKYQHGANVNTVWTRGTEDTKYLLEYQQPLLHLIPITNKKVVLEHHLLNTNDFLNLASRSRAVKFINKYRAAKSTMQERGCPFHFKAEK